MRDAVSLSSGRQHACAVRTDGTVRCWGRNYDGQLGDGTTKDRHKPRDVVGLTDVVQVAAGSVHSCALRANGRVRCWGHNNLGQVGTGAFSDPVLTQTPVVQLQNVAAIAAGRDHSCALRQNGTVRCWGRNTHGALGDGTTIPRPQPVAVLFPAP